MRGRRLVMGLPRRPAQRELPSRRGSLVSATAQVAAPLAVDVPYRAESVTILHGQVAGLSDAGAGQLALVTCRSPQPSTALLAGWSRTGPPGRDARPSQWQVVAELHPVRAVHHRYSPGERAIGDSSNALSRSRTASPGPASSLPKRTA
jgi:hypothetical protein